MSKEAMSVSPGGTRSRTWVSIGRWWRQTGEPVVLSGIVGVVCTIPLLMLGQVLTFEQGLHFMLGLGWLAGVLLLPRLPRLLQQEQRRIAVMVVVGLAAAVLPLFSSPDTPRLIRSADADAASLPYVPDGLNQFEDEGIILAISQVRQETTLTFKSPPRISREMFAALLQQGTGGAGTSPAAPYAEELYDILLSYELDPAVAMAIFAQESQFCTTGICASYDMKNWGAIGRRITASGRRIRFMPVRGRL